jgi:flagellar biosynthesis component FlhA
MDDKMKIGIFIIMAGIIGFQFYLLKSIKETKKEAPTEVEKPKQAKLTKEQKEKQEKLRKSFENMMGYGYEDALKKKE